ncbi:hypothetical protein STAL104432_04945 [Streptomyces albus]
MPAVSAAPSPAPPSSSSAPRVKLLSTCDSVLPTFASRDASLADSDIAAPRNEPTPNVARPRIVPKICIQTLAFSAFAFSSANSLILSAYWLIAWPIFQTASMDLVHRSLRPSVQHSCIARAALLCHFSSKNNTRLSRSYFCS